MKLFIFLIIREYFFLVFNNKNWHRGLAMNISNPDFWWDWNMDLPDNILNHISTFGWSYSSSCQEKFGFGFEKYPILFENEELIAFPSGPFLWFTFDDVGIYQFAKYGRIDTRKQIIIDVDSTSAYIYSYAKK